MKTIILAALMMVAATNYAQKADKYVCVFKSIYNDTLVFRINYTKLKKRQTKIEEKIRKRTYKNKPVDTTKLAHQRTKKGLVYLLKDGTLKIKKNKQLYAYTGVNHSIPYFQNVTYISFEV